MHAITRRSFITSSALAAGTSLMVVGGRSPARAAPPVAGLSEKTADNLHTAGIRRRLIAIDNVCAWPNLVRLPDGSLVAIVFNQPSHGWTEGDVDCWGSADGLLWKHLSTVTRHRPETVRMNHGAGLNRDGHLVVLCNGWDKLTPRRNSASRPIHTVAAISRDGGLTWERNEEPALPRVEGYSWQVPFGDIVPAANGDLVAGTYAFGKREEAVRQDALNPKKDTHDGMRGHVYAARSRDGGRTWNHFAPVIKDRHVEAAMLHAGSGRWLAAARRFGFRDLDLFVSDDDAFTWRHLVAMPELGSVSAAHLLKLSDGRLLLTYGNRNADNRGIDVRVSRDAGRTWAPPQRLIHLETGDLGYPDTVELADGRLLVAYYTGGIPQHQRYHMGVINLTLDEIR